MVGLLVQLATKVALCCTLNADGLKFSNNIDLTRFHPASIIPGATFAVAEDCDTSAHALSRWLLHGFYLPGDQLCFDCQV